MQFAASTKAVLGYCQYQGQNFSAVPLFCVVIEAPIEATKLNQSKALAFI